jgi:apolipoprotein N-acyltransferase
MRSLFGNLHAPSSFSPLSGQAPGRTARGSGGLWFLVCVAAGLLQAAALAWPWAGWAPPGLAPGQPSGGLQIGSLALLVLALRHAHRVGQGVWRAWVFATAWLAGTFWWLFVSMHTYGGLPAWMAVLAVLALAGLLALYYALAAAVLCLWAPHSRALQALLFGALWTLAELLRGTWFTGFPWGAGGYAQVDLMVAWAPWVGVYGMGLLAAWLAYAVAVLLPAAVSGLLALAGPARARAAGASGAGGAGSRRPLSVWPAAVALLLLLSTLFAGPGLLPWGQRQMADAGALRVWLLQGNIAQDQKFEPGTGMAQALDWYPGQIGEALQQAGRGGAAPQLVVAPETAIPLLPQQLGPDFWRPLLGALAAQPVPGPAAPASNGPVGVLMGLPLGSYQLGYTNSAWGLSPASAAQALAGMAGLSPGDALQGRGLPDDAGFYRYDKHHLVPFGEFIPPLFRWFVQLMNIPLGDFSRGALPQPAWSWAGQRIAPNICYEDLFGEELAAAFRDPATAPTLLLNLSNIAWFGDTVAIDQHLQISRLRALELGRPMLRATNTGATAVIDHNGRVTHQLPRLTRERLQAEVNGRSGLTPYARWASRWGLWPLWITCLAIAAAVVLLRPARRGRGARP